MVEAAARVFQKLLDGRLYMFGSDLVEGSAEFDPQEGIGFTGGLHGVTLTILAPRLVHLLAHFVPHLAGVVLDFGLGFFGVLLDFLFGLFQFVFGEIRVFLGTSRQTRGEYDYHSERFQRESSLVMDACWCDVFRVFGARMFLECGAWLVE